MSFGLIVTEVCCHKINMNTKEKDIIKRILKLLTYHEWKYYLTCFAAEISIILCKHQRYVQNMTAIVCVHTEVNPCKYKQMIESLKIIDLVRIVQENVHLTRHTK